MELLRNGIPLYLQIEEYIKRKIEDGEWEKGEQIPTEKELCAYFEVSPSTIRQAISNLMQKGMLVKKQGKGTFVCKPAYEGDFLTIYFPEEFGDVHELLQVGVTDASAGIRKRLEAGEGEEVTLLYRARYITGDEEPAILEKSYLKSAMFPGIENQDLTGKIFPIIQKVFGYKLESAMTWVEPILLTDDEAQILHSGMGNPALLLTRISYTLDKKPIIYTKSIVRADKCKLLMIK